jgi:hypothetical protein
MVGCTVKMGCTASSSSEKRIMILVVYEILEKPDFIVLKSENCHTFEHLWSEVAKQLPWVFRVKCYFQEKLSRLVVDEELRYNHLLKHTKLAN